MLAQSLGSYGLLSGASDGLARATVWADVWTRDWGPVAVAAGLLALSGWVLLKLLART